MFQAVGRTPNGKKIAADQAGVAVTDRGFIHVDIQMRTSVPHIFAMGDIVGGPCWRTRRSTRGMWLKKGLCPWAATSRATASGRTEGFTKLLFDDSDEAHGHVKILGGVIVGPNAGDLIGEVALAIEMDADAVGIGKSIHPIPRWARAYAWRPRWRMAAAQTCRLRRSKRVHTGAD